MLELKMNQNWTLKRQSRNWNMKYKRKRNARKRLLNDSTSIRMPIVVFTILLYQIGK
jgi:hypothetical protein